MKAKQSQNKKIEAVLVDFLIKAALMVSRVKAALFHKQHYDFHHLQVALKRWSVSVRWVHHDDYALEMEAELYELQNELSSEEFIEHAIASCRDCNFLIFDCGDDTKFVQFWLGDGKIIGNWPMVKGNNLKRYKLAMLGVLNELGIVRDFEHNNKWPDKYPFRYTLIRYQDFDEYVMNFGKDVHKASEFTRQVLTQVFRYNLDNLTFKVG